MKPTSCIPFRALTLALLSACTTAGAPVVAVAPQANTTPPPIQREMRGIWFTTVNNTDWPSRPGLTADQQRAELVDLLDRTVAGGFNTVVFHVRPAGDAVYASQLEPWGAMLTGTQGVGPGYDPLAFAVAESHARGLEIHAWINPFRAGNTKDSAALAPTHQFNTHRELVRVYGTQLWFDPGEPAVRDHGMRVLSDIVQRYDVDGVHVDDYFYPYQQNDSAGHLIDFPDSASYARSGSTLSIADWRRENVDTFVERMYREVHAIKPGVKVGISPFGIWRPGNPASVAGLDAYATLYADSRKWLQQGWVDYFTPQLYWAIDSPKQSFPALLDWWLSQNTLGRSVWPGLATYRVASGTASSFSATEIPSQVALARSRGGSVGEIFFNATTTLKKSGGAVTTSLAPLYATNALVPASAWMSGVAPAAPTVTVEGRTVRMTANGDAPRWWVIRWHAGGAWSTKVLFGATNAYTLDRDVDRVALNAVDWAGRVSDASTWAAR